MKFWQLYRIISRRKWLVLGLVVFTLAAVYFSTTGDKPYYRASVKLMPSEAALGKAIFSDPMNPAGVGRNQLPTLMTLIKSRQVAERTIRTAHLEEDPDHLLERIEVGTVDNPGAKSSKDLGTNIIRIKVNDDDGQRAVRTVNAVAHVFAGFYQELSHQEALDNLRFLESEMIRAEGALSQAEKKLKEFKRSEGIVSLGDTESNSDSIRRTREYRDSARADLAQVQAELNQVNRLLASTSPTMTVKEGTSDTPMVQQLEAQQADVQRQLNDARSRYQDTHPKVIALKDSLAAVTEKLRSERSRMRDKISVVRNPVYDGLLQQKATLSARRDGLAAKVSQLDVAVASVAVGLKPDVPVTLLRLENEFLGAQQRHAEFQAKVSQARIDVADTTSKGAIRVIDEATKSEGPIGSNRSLFLIMGAMLSLVLGVGIAITLDSLDNRIKTTLDVEQLLGLPVTALIPNASASPNALLARIAYTEPLSPISEAYRFLRTDMLLSTQISGAKAIMVATAKPGQGGTSTVANLAISLALDGKRVVLVDADMRRPSLHRIFKVQNEVGLSNVLSNEKDFGDVLFSTEVDNLLIIPGGTTPSNPSELLGSGRMRSLVHWLTEHADYVLFDTPSAIAFTDAVVLSQVVDGVILVIRAQQVPRGAELQVRNLLNKANANILGVVLNDVAPESVDSYYYHSHYYPDVGKSQHKILQNIIGARSLPPTEEQSGS